MGSKQLKWAAIGASDIAAGKMIPAIRATGGEVVAVLSSSAERGAQYAQAHHIDASYTDLQQLLVEADSDAVYISTTNELHSEQVLAAAAAGKHVLCEKPLSTSLEEAKRMAAACREAGVVMATNHHLRNSHSHVVMRDLVRSGVIGRPNSARVFHAVYLRESLQGWRINQAAAGGGVVLDITVHDIDSLRFLLDANPTEAVSLSHNAGMAAGTLEDGNMAVVRFDNDLLAQIHVSFSVPHAGHGLEIHGDKGSIIATGVMAQGGEQKVTLRTADGEQQFDIEPSNYYVAGLEAFNRAVAGEGEVAASAEDGLWSLASALAVLQSAEQGRQVAISLG
ncbi:MAG: Gfo/Idh/MocA family protein [Granulosicoccaceae bacterium]